jgi:hypothetical protein
MRRNGAPTTRSRYRNPATLPGLRVELIMASRGNCKKEGFLLSSPLLIVSTGTTIGPCAPGRQVLTWIRCAARVAQASDSFRIRRFTQSLHLASIRKSLYFRIGEPGVATHPGLSRLSPNKNGSSQKGGATSCDFSRNDSLRPSPLLNYGFCIPSGFSGSHSSNSLSTSLTELVGGSASIFCRIVL